MPLLLLLFAACTADLVERRGRSRHGPANEKPGGRVRYLLVGVDSVVQQRRESAYQQMFAECGGDYDVVAEWDEVNGTLTSVTASGRTDASAYGSPSPYTWNAAGSSTSRASAFAVSSDLKYRLIDFECRSRSTKARKQARAPAAPFAMKDDGLSTEPSPAARDLPEEPKAAEPVALSPGEASERARSFLSLETGCPAANITVEGAMPGAERLRACGKAYVCIDGLPAPSCRLALSEFDGGQ